MNRTFAMFVAVALTTAGCGLFGGGDETPEPTATAPATPGGGPVTVGAPTKGTFAPGLPTDAEGKPYIDYTLAVTKAATYRIDLVSSNTAVYDPYIRLMQGTNEVASDDDGGDQPLQSRLSKQLQPGSYTVRVTRFGAGAVASPVPFTLTVAEQAPAAPAAPAGGTTLTLGTPAAGVFTPALPTDDSGKPYIDYTLTIATAGNYTIELLSSNTGVYDPYIRLMQGTNEIATDDDGHEQSLQSRLTHQLQPGTYTVRVTKFGTGAVASPVPFTLTARQG